LLKRSKLVITFLATVMLVIIMYAVSFATETTNAPNTSGFAGCMGLILFIICYSRRLHEVGGWYLYYVIQLFIAIALFLFMNISTYSSFNPANYQNLGYYLLFLLTDLPGGIFLIGQAIIILKMVSDSGRDWKYVKILMLILWGDLIFSTLRVVIDLKFSPSDLVFAIMAIIWPCIWLPYFKRSKRIEKIYKTNTWGIEILKHFVPDEDKNEGAEEK
jgi:hypothetical protein